MRPFAQTFPITVCLIALVIVVALLGIAFRYYSRGKEQLRILREQSIPLGAILHVLTHAR